MTSVTPTITVLLDDGTGTYPTDVTARVSLSAGVTVNNHGRTDENPLATSATFNCTLKNNDGALSTGAVSLYPGQGIRYKQHFGATTVNRFTGRISEAGLGWEGGVAKASNVPIMAVDLLSELALRSMRSFVEYEWLAFSPTAYYTCGENVGSVSAGDSSGNGAPALVSTGSGAGYTFGATDGLLEGTGVTFAGGKYLSAPGYLPTAGFALLVTFDRASAPGSLEILAMFGDTFLALETSGKVSVYRGGSLATLVTTSSGSLCDGTPYVVGFAVKPGVGYDFVQGGFTVSSVGDATANLGSSQPLSIGGAGATSSGATISHAVLLTSMPTTLQFTSLSNTIAGVSKSPNTQAQTIATYLGISFSNAGAVGTLGVQGAVMPVPTVTGGSILDAFQLCATTENGVLFVDGSGTLQYQGRYYRMQKLTPTLTVAAKDVNAWTTIPWDTQQVVNVSTVTRVGGSSQIYQDPTSVALRGTYAQSLEIVVSDDASALYAAQWQVNKHSTPIPRIGSASIKNLTSSQAEQLIQAEIGDRWSLSGMPSQNWTSFGDLSLEGWSETLVVTDSTADWSITANLLPWSLFQAWILGDTTYSVLGSTTIPAY